MTTKDLRLSPSFAHTLLDRSPLHAWSESRQGGNEREEPTPAMLRGLVVDALFFGHPERVYEVPFDDYKKDKAKEAKAAALAAGQIPCLSKNLHEITVALGIQQAVLQDEYGIVVAGRGESKKEIEWASGNGALCKGEIDHLDLPGNWINELKSTENAHPGFRGRNAVEAGQDIQMAAYLEGVTTLHPETSGRMRFRWFFLEPSPPYAVVVAMPSGEMLELGRQRWIRATYIFRECVESGIWPGYTKKGEVATLHPPGWAMSQELEASLMRDIVEEMGR